jgi:hypothetical protein
LKAVAFFSVAIGLAILAMFFGDPEGSRKAAGGITVGPMLIGYALWGLQRGRFPEISIANRQDSQIWFWFCFSTFLIVGLGVLVVGVQHFIGR